VRSNRIVYNNFTILPLGTEVLHAVLAVRSNRIVYNNFLQSCVFERENSYMKADSYVMHPMFCFP
jgi:hypothetical protein